MSTISAGVYKKLYYKKQTALGTIAPGGAATGQSLRRVTSTVDLTKASYKSNEIRPSLQRADFRHGVRSVAGTISGELSPGTYQDFMCSILRQTAQAVVTTGAQVNFTSAVTTGASGTITRAAGSFITDGFKLYDLVTQSGWATTGAANNAHLAIITALTATVMTITYLDGVAMGAKAAGDSVTIVQAGKKTYVPQSGHTREYYTIEHWFSDIAQDEVFSDCVMTDMAIKLPATGMGTIDFTVKGLNLVTNTSAYFTSPAAPTTTGVLAAVNGALYVNGAVVAYITALDFTVNGNYTMPGGVVGANVDPDIFPGVVECTGNVSVLFVDNVMRDLFVNETVASLAAVFTTGSGSNPGFMSVVMPTVKFSGAQKDDGEKGLTLTMPFTAIENTAGGAGVNTLATTISIQDSSFV